MKGGNMRSAPCRQFYHAVPAQGTTGALRVFTLLGGCLVSSPKPQILWSLLFFKGFHWFLFITDRLPWFTQRQDYHTDNFRHSSSKHHFGQNHHVVLVVSWSNCQNFNKKLNFKQLCPLKSQNPTYGSQVTAISNKMKWPTFMSRRDKIIFSWWMV